MRSRSKPTGSSPLPATAEELSRRNVEIIADIERAFHHDRTFGQKMADGVASIIGSWPFIICQSVLLVIWMVVNIAGWVFHWDPYPFILLNLCLSLQAAFASPIIMMSQNRAGQVNEKRNQLDLQVNLLAEQEATEMLKLLRSICEHHGIAIPGGTAMEALTKATEPSKLVEQIAGAASQKPEKK